MKRIVIAIATVFGLAMTMGADIADARGGGGGHGGGSGHPGGGSGHPGGYHGGYHGGHHGGYYGGHHGGHYGGWYGGIYYGGPWYWGWPWYGGVWPYYPYGQYAVYESAPTVYVEPAASFSAAAEPQPSPPNLWFYCTDPAGYHPYVQNCNVPWVKVVPPPPSAAKPSGSIAPGPAKPAWQTAPTGQPAR